MIPNQDEFLNNAYGKTKELTAVFLKEASSRKRIAELETELAEKNAQVAYHSGMAKAHVHSLKKITSALGTSSKSKYDSISDSESISQMSDGTSLSRSSESLD